MLLAISVMSAVLVVGCAVWPWNKDNDLQERFSEFAEYLSVRGGCVIYEGPWMGIKNDTVPTQNTTLYGGDFLRFPETQEIGEMLRVVQIGKDCAVIEYTYYSLPPAPEEQRSREFQICKSN
jgi:hypothetical protein